MTARVCGLKISEIAARSEFNVEEIEVHVHILLTISPSILWQSILEKLSNIRHKAFGVDSNGSRSNFGLKKFWSDGYFVCSVGNASADIIQEYIQEQG